MFRKSPVLPPGQPSTAGRLTADGKRLYRLTGPVVLWWAWVAIAAVGLGDLVVQGRDVLSLRFAFGLLTVTGLVYACAMWPSVVADEDGLSVRNPFRIFEIPWGAVKAIYLADSVEVQCARPAPRKDKTVYSWALASPRRARARAQLRGTQIDTGRRSQPGSYGRMPESARAMARTSTAELMARELAELSEQARSQPASADLGSAGLGSAGLGSAGLGPAARRPAAQGSAGEAPADQGTAAVTARWAWIPAAAVLVPGVALLIAALAG